MSSVSRWRGLRLPAKLRSRLLLLVVVPMLPTVGLVVYDAMQLRRTTVDAAVSDARRLVHVGAALHRQRIKATERFLGVLSRDPRLQSGAGVGCQSALLGYAAEHPEYANLAVVRVDGDVTCSALVTATHVRLDTPDQAALIARAVRSRRFAVGDYEIGTISHRPVIVTMYPMVDARGRVDRLVLASLDLAWVSDFAINALLPTGATMSVIDRRGRMAAHYPDPGKWVGHSVAGSVLNNEVLRQHGEGTSTGLAVDGVTRLYAFTPLESWETGKVPGLRGVQYMSVGIPVQGLHLASRQALTTNLGLLFVVCCIATFVAALVADATLAHPVRRVLDATRRMADGDLAARTGVARSESEIAEVAAAFDDMAESLERRRRAEKLAVQERDGLFMLSLDLLCVFGFDGRFKRLNPAWTTLLGYELDELVGTPFLAVIHPDDMEAAATESPRLAGPWETRSFEVRVRARNGGYLHTIWNAIPMPGSDAFYASGRDITERKQGEDLLRHERDYVSRIIAVTPSLIVGLAPDGSTVFVNPAVEATTGYRAQDLIGRNWWSTFYPGEQYAQVEALFRCFEDGPVRDYEMDLTTAGGELRTVSWSSLSVFDAAGGLEEAIGFGTDVTERKRAEQQRDGFEIQLRQAQKLESLGQLAAGIAHEINTPTQYIGDNLHFLSESIADLDPLLGAVERLASATPAEAGETRSTIERLVAGADLSYVRTQLPNAITQSIEGLAHVARIVRAMKEFAHPGSGYMAPLDLNRALESTITVATSEWKYVAELTSDFDETLPPVLALAGELNQAFLNLIVNAAQAIDETRIPGEGGRGRIVISTRHVPGWAEVRVSDTGAGIPEHVRTRVFDPFFTTKPVGKGTGQGLAICHAVIVERHSGQITFEPAPGGGTTFVVRLPLGDAYASRPALQPAA